MSCDKRTYPDKKAAKSAADRRQSRQPGRRRGKQKFLRVYHCDRCNGWHLTHQHPRDHSDRTLHND